jgi:hypothetical protein
VELQSLISSAFDRLWTVIGRRASSSSSDIRTSYFAAIFVPAVKEHSFAIGAEPSRQLRTPDTSVPIKASGWQATGELCSSDC